MGMILIVSGEQTFIGEMQSFFPPECFDFCLAADKDEAIRVIGLKMPNCLVIDLRSIGVEDALEIRQAVEEGTKVVVLVPSDRTGIPVSANFSINILLLTKSASVTGPFSPFSPFSLELKSLPYTCMISFPASLIALKSVGMNEYEDSKGKLLISIK